jgi:glutamate/tyrosine decarboxylase-like PLP-dependent enzyme
VHTFDADTDRLLQQAIEYSRTRLRLDPVPLDGPKPPEVLRAQAGQTITKEGLGGDEALRVFSEVLAPATLSVDNPRYLAFIPAAPTEAATLFDLVVGASSIFGGSWLEGAGAVYAENQALRWISDLAGLPDSAGGCFVQGGTVGNLSALVAARYTATVKRESRPERWAFVCSEEAHSSMQHAARVMDVDVVLAPVDEHGRMTAESLRSTIQRHGVDNLFAIVATAGTTNYGVVDDLQGAVDVGREHGLWVHVDGAYGLAAMCAPSARPVFDGIEGVDSLIVDPHKWLFAPFDACALVYREPALAKAAHTQTAGYLEAINEDTEWNPSDYAIHLSRRARGLPFWFSLAVHGTDAYCNAVEHTLEVARAAADGVRRRSYLELVREPNLSVVVFRRLGWTRDDYYAWSDRLLAANFAFVLPTTHKGEPVARFAIVNPRTSEADVNLILDTMAG